MKIAIPTADGRLCPHFGHCQVFTIIDVDVDSKTINSTESVPAPPHQPGLLPRWLAEQGANIIIAGGMGSRAQMIFAENNIQVVVGASSDEPENVVKAYLDGTLATSGNICDH